jgi:hypothetical protein
MKPFCSLILLSNSIACTILFHTKKNKPKNLTPITNLLHILNNTIIFNNKAFQLKALLLITMQQDSMWFSAPRQ